MRFRVYYTAVVPFDRGVIIRDRFLYPTYETCFFQNSRYLRERINFNQAPHPLHLSLTPFSRRRTATLFPLFVSCQVTANFYPAETFAIPMYDASVPRQPRKAHCKDAFNCTLDFRKNMIDLELKLKIELNFLSLVNLKKKLKLN